MVYLVTYDLNKPGKNYEGVYQAIKSASTGVWCHYLESAWLIKSSLSTAASVLSLIRPHLDNNDRCMVLEVTDNSQGYFSQNEWQYIRTHIFA